jgi:hypothetical protein
MRNYREFHNQYDDPVNSDAPDSQDTAPEEGTALVNGPED